MRWNTYIARKLLSGGYGMQYNWFCTQAQAAGEYEYLYNWYAATDSRNICSVGWHIPTETDWDNLGIEIGGDTNGYKLKEIGTVHWLTPNTGATNEVGFNARPSGVRDEATGAFSTITTASRFMSSTVVGSLNRYRELYYNQSMLTGNGGSISHKQGVSVRPIKDSTTLTNGQTGTYVDPSGIIYPTICIGTQEWVACNIMTKHYRNGDAIPEVTDNTAWAALTTGARCSYNNTESNAGTTKKLSSSDSFIVPTKTIWEGLLNYVDVFDYDLSIWPLAGGKLKETGTTHWDSPNEGATNEFGFNAVGSGYRNSEGVFNGVNLNTTYFTSTEFDSNLAYVVGMAFDSSVVEAQTGSSAEIGFTGKIEGYSIRLCNPNTLNAEGSVNSYTQNDGTIIPTIVINGVEWTMNLKETRWSDGTDIQNITDNTAWSLLQSAACCDIDNDSTKR